MTLTSTGEVGSLTWYTDLDWRLIPKGYYALPVIGHGTITADDDPETWEPPLLAYQTYRRRTEKHNDFRCGALYPLWANWDADPEHLPGKDDVGWSRESELFVNNCYSNPVFAIEEILGDPGAADRYRALFGQFFGLCGICHRTLSDPQSKLRGIGPECVKGLRLVTA